jgi:hypothetical protein
MWCTDFLFLENQGSKYNSSMRTISSNTPYNTDFTWSADFFWPGDELRRRSLCWGESLFRRISAWWASWAANCFSCWIRADTSCLCQQDKGQFIQLVLILLYFLKPKVYMRCLANYRLFTLMLHKDSCSVRFYQSFLRSWIVVG